MEKKINLQERKSKREAKSAWGSGDRIESGYGQNVSSLDVA